MFEYSLVLTKTRSFHEEGLTHAIIGAAMEVHSMWGPGLLESAYQDAVSYELRELKLEYIREKVVPARYKEMIVDRVFRPDLIVANAVIVELKCVEKILPIHEAQVQTYLKITGIQRGLIINFNVRLLKDGIRRVERTS